MPKQITVRNVSAALGRRLAQMSYAKGQSLNTTVLRILESAAGVSERRARLARYATWSADDLAEFEDALRAQRMIDERLWR